MMKEPIVVVGARIWGDEILISLLDLVKASHTSVENLTDRENPIYSQK
jgi:hypothetical protein